MIRTDPNCPSLCIVIMFSMCLGAYVVPLVCLCCLSFRFCGEVMVVLLSKHRCPTLYAVHECITAQSAYLTDLQCCFHKVKPAHKGKSWDL